MVRTRKQVAIRQANLFLDGLRIARIDVSEHESELIGFLLGRQKFGQQKNCGKSKKECETAAENGEQPDERNGCGPAEAATNEAMREMIVVADVEGFAQARANENNGDEIPERHGEKEDRAEACDCRWTRRGPEVGLDGEDGEEEADQVASGVAEKGGGARVVEREESERRTAHSKGEHGDWKLTVQDGDAAGERGRDDAESGAKTVHVVHEVEGVRHGENPENGDGVVQERVRGEDIQVNARSSHGCSDEELAGEFDDGFEFKLVVEQAEQSHGGCADEDGSERGGLLRELAGGFGVEKVRDYPGSEQCDENACENGETAGEGNGLVVNLPVTGIIDEFDAAAPCPPERQGQRRDERSGEA